MNLTEKVRSEMVMAMKEKNKARKDTLSALLAALKNKGIDLRRELTEAEEAEVVKKEIRQITETLESAPAERTDITTECATRIEILKEFVAEDLNKEQISAIIIETIAELGIDSPQKKDKGAIMKALMPKVKGKADGKLVNSAVEEFLN